ncbi:hypothetical protein WMF37_44740 [Sorangium sp. So ce291]|uniref:hypothetical protein n=1 Tax=Sorangium sp. So ce291 TaxID=3133294 RepID=UPI003F638D56
MACGDDDPSAGSGGSGTGGHAEGGGGAGAGGHAEGGGGAGGSREGGGGDNAEGGGGAGAGGNAEGGGGAGAGAGGNAEGGGGAGAGGNAEGGGGAGAGGNDEGGDLEVSELAIAYDESFTAECATFVDGAWGVGETGFLNGEVTNDDCALVPVIVEGTPYWISSSEFEGDIDLDSVEHSFSTAEAEIAEGSYLFVLRNFVYEELFSGTLDVAYVTDYTVTLSIQ